VAVEESVLQEYVNNYWGDAFPTYDIPNRLTVKKNKVHIYADLPYVPKAQQKTLMENIQHDISELLSRIFGYRQDLTLSITFQKETKPAEGTVEKGNKANKISNSKPIL